jgi:hypothetical protein
LYGNGVILTLADKETSDLKKWHEMAYLWIFRRVRYDDNTLSRNCELTNVKYIAENA